MRSLGPLEVPVEVKDAYNKVIAQPIKVTLFFDDTTPAPRPVLVINHGRAPDAVDRAKMGRARYGDNARWFAAQGFLVAVPTRIGYGVTGGDDIETSGDCNRKNYPPGYLAAARQTQAAGSRIASPRRRACANASATASLATSGSPLNSRSARQSRSRSSRYERSIAPRPSLTTVTSSILNRIGAGMAVSSTAPHEKCQHLGTR